MKITETGDLFEQCKCFTTDTGCSILCGYEPVGWHLSISHKERNPTWEEIKQVRYELMPKDVNIGMILPPEENYVNIHQHCFHLFELDLKEASI